MPAKTENNPTKAVRKERSRGPCAKDITDMKKSSKPNPEMMSPVMARALARHRELYWNSSFLTMVRQVSTSTTVNTPVPKRAKVRTSRTPMKKDSRTAMPNFSNSLDVDRRSCGGPKNN